MSSYNGKDIEKFKELGYSSKSEMRRVEMHKSNIDKLLQMVSSMSPTQLELHCSEISSLIFIIQSLTDDLTAMASLPQGHVVPAKQTAEQILAKAEEIASNTDQI